MKIDRRYNLIEQYLSAGKVPKTNLLLTLVTNRQSSRFPLLIENQLVASKITLPCTGQNKHPMRPCIQGPLPQKDCIASGVYFRGSKVQIFVYARLHCPRQAPSIFSNFFCTLYYDPGVLEGQCSFPLALLLFVPLTIGVENYILHLHWSHLCRDP